MSTARSIIIEPGRPEHVDAVADLIWSTGPVSYRYIFGSREYFDTFVRRSWQTPDTYFGHSEARVARDGDRVVGLEIGYDGERNYLTKARLSLVAESLVAAGQLTAGDVEQILQRARLASFLNPFVPRSAYYVLAIAVSERVRGSGVGAALLDDAFARARRGGCDELQLDVLSDNPAVGFYRSRGLDVLAETVAPIPCREHGIPMELRMGVVLSPG